MNAKTKSLCTLPMPYPRINVERRDVMSARRLSSAYAGNGGELSAILFYTYAALMTENDELKDTLECVSITEMKHLEILGKLIKALGGDPKFYDWNTRRYFDASKVEYRASDERIIRSALESERAAVKHYRALLDSTNDKSVKDILKRIILDEEHHIKIFTELSGR
ncbi:MAG: manganese catalase family protein [Clostridia bacterium]|nr:manganese catalase family protein [Clostridia bacterium]